MISYIVIPSILMKHFSRGILVINLKTAILLGQTRQLSKFSCLYYYFIDIPCIAHTHNKYNYILRHPGKQMRLK